MTSDFSELIEPIFEAPAKVYVDGVYVGEINTQYQLLNIRLKVAKGEVQNVSFLFNNKMIDCDSKGNLDSWPKGFFDLIENQLCELLGWKK